MHSKKSIAFNFREKYYNLFLRKIHGRSKKKSMVGLYRSMDGLLKVIIYNYISILTIRDRESRTAKSVQISKRGCRNPRTAELVRVFFKGGAGIPRITGSVKILKGGCRDPRTAKSVRFSRKE